MLIKQSIAPILHRGQCTVQRKQHVEKSTAERIFKACLCKTGVHVECVRRMLTFAAQQSILQMHMQTIKVMYGGCVYVGLFHKTFTYRTSAVPHGETLFIDSQFTAHRDFSAKPHIIMKRNRVRLSRRRRVTLSRHMYLISGRTRRTSSVSPPREPRRPTPAPAAPRRSDSGSPVIEQKKKKKGHLV